MSASESPRPPAFRARPYLSIALVLLGLVVVRALRTEGLVEENLFNTWLFYGIIVLGFWFVFGISGQFAFSQAAFAGLGAYTSVWATQNGRPFVVGILTAVIVCMVVAAAFSLLVRRAEHFYFAIATLGLSEVLLLVFRTWEGFTGGGEVVNVTPVSLFGWEVSGPERDTQAFWMLLVVLGLLLVLAAVLERSPVVREAIAVRDRPLVSSTLGLPVVRIRTVMFVLGSCIAGFAGALLVHWRGSAVSEQFGVDLGLAIFLMLILGGTGSRYGALLGAWFYVYVQDALRSLDDTFDWLESVGPLHDFLSDLDQYWPIVYGTSLVLVMIAMPEGIIGLVHRAGTRLGGSPVGGLVRRFPGLQGRDAAPADAATEETSATAPAPDVGRGPVAEPRPAPSTETILEARNISVSFGGVRAVDDVDATVHRGEILGLIGPNGSGKSTLLNAVTGVVPAGGSLLVAGAKVPLGRPKQVRAAGVIRTYQTPQTYTALTCLENVLLADPDRRRSGVVAALARPLVLADERARWARASSALERVGLGPLAETSAAALSYGQQRMLELARVIASEPKVVLLDEPSAGLNDHETEVLAGHLAQLRRDGVSLLVVDHKIDFISSLCDRVIVLELGNLVAEGDPHDIWHDERVQNAYLGVTAGES